MTLKFKLMSLFAVAALAITACKDPIVIDPVKPQDPRVIIPDDPCGVTNGIAPGGCIRYENDFNVVFLPLQCEGGNSDQIGVELDGKYYRVNCDRTGKFGSYRPGDTVRLGYWLTDDCVFTTACSTPWADGCIVIENLDDDPTK